MQGGSWFRSGSAVKDKIKPIERLTGRLKMITSVQFSVRIANNVNWFYSLLHNDRVPFIHSYFSVMKITDLNVNKESQSCFA